MAMHKVWGPLSLLLVVAGLAFFAYFVAAWGGATDVGVYSVTVMLVGMGLAGFWASRNMAEAVEES